MKERSNKDYQYEIGILNHLLTVQNAINTLHSIDEIAGIGASSLKLIPGINQASICLFKHEKPFGDSFDASIKLAASLSGISEYKEKNSIRFRPEKNLVIFNIQTARVFFGYVLIIINDNNEFENFGVAVESLINVISNNLEINLQNDRITEHEQHIEGIVRKHTSDLQEEITSLVHSQKDFIMMESIMDSIGGIGTFGMIYQIAMKPDGTRRFTYLSDSVKQLYGVSPEEGIADSSLIYRQVHKDDIELLKNLEDLAIKKFVVSKAEVRIINPSGECRWSLLVSTPKMHKDGSLYFDGIEFIITEHKNLEIALKESEKKTRAILDFSFGFIGLLSVKGILLEANNTSLEFVGVEKPEVIGKPFWKTKWWAHSPEDQKRIKDAVKSAAKGKFFRTETTHRSISGKLHSFDFSIKPFFDENGKVTYLITEGHDITERNLNKLSLSQSEEQFRSIIENSTIGFYRTSPEGKIIMANPAMVQMLQFSSFEEFAKRDLTKEGFRSSYQRQLFVERIELNGQVTGIESSWVSKKGSTVYVRESAKAIRDSNSKTLYYDGIVEDISERKEAEEAIINSEMQFRTLFEEARDGIAYFSMAGGIVQINEAYARLHGYSVFEMQSIKNNDIEADRFSGISTERIQRIKNGEDLRFEVKHFHKNGQIVIFEVSTCFLNLDEDDFIVAFYRDITDRKIAEEKIFMFAYALQSINESVSITDLNDKIIYVNNAFKETYHYSENDLLGSHINIVRSPKNNPSLLRKIHPATLDGAWKGELLSRRKDGSEFPVLLSRSLIRDDKGDPVAIIGISNDITRRKSEEYELLQSKRRLNRGEEVAKSGNWEFHRKRNQFVFSEGTVAILGLQDQIYDFSVVEHLLLPGYKESLKDAIDKFLNDTLPFEMEFKVWNSVSGELIDIKAIAEFNRKEDIIFGVIQNITIQKKAQEALINQSKKLEHLLEISKIFASTFNMDVLLLTILKSAVKLFDLDTGAFYLIRNDELYLAVASPELPPDSPEILKNAQIINHPHIARALKSKNHLAINDLSIEILTADEQMVINGKKLLSVLYLPIIVDNRPEGILIVGNTKSRHTFEKNEIDLYCMLSTQAAVVIENVSLYNKTQQYTLDLEQKNTDLKFLNSLAFELSELPYSEDLYEFMIKKLSVYTDAVFIASSDYDPVSKEMILTHLHTDKNLLNKILKGFGIKTIQIPALVTDQLYRQMVSEIVTIKYSLTDLSFGTISEDIDKSVRTLTGFCCYYAIAVIASGELVGGFMLAFKSGQKLPQYDLMISVGHLVAAAIRRYEAEKALIISETMQRAVLANSFDAITIIDKDGYIKYESPNVQKQYGWHHDELIGTKGFDLVHPDDLDNAMEFFSEILKNGGSVYDLEYRYLCKDGSYKWVRNTGINLLNDPVINGILVNYHDISGRKKTEENLHKFRLGIERSPEAVFITDRDGIITYANPSFSKIYGYSAEEVVGSNPRIIKSGKYSKGIYESFWNTLLSKNPVEGEIVNKRKDGRLISIEASNSPILDEDKKIIGFLGIHRDISHRKQKEEELKFSEERFRKSFFTSPDSIAIYRFSDGMFMSVNEGFTILTGYTIEDIAGKTSLEIDIWADSSDREKLISGLKKSGLVKNIEAKFRLKNGSIKTGLMSAVTIDFNGVPHILSITRDIDEIKKTQNALQESEERFKQVAENAEEWIWEMDPTGLYTYSSPIVEKILGYKPLEIVGKKYFYDFFSPENKEQTKTECFKIINKNGIFKKFINQNTNKSGKIVYLETSGAPILDKDGNLLGYRGTDSDVTREIEYKQELRKLSIAVEQSPASIIITDLKSKIEYVNPRFTQTTGYLSEEVIGKTPSFLKSGKTSDEEYKTLWSNIVAGKEWSGEFYNKKKNGEFFWESASISPIMNSFGEITHYLAVKEDITEKKEATNYVIDKIIETEEQERLRYSNELHDGLGPIISTIKLYFQLLSDNPEASQRKIIIDRTNSCIEEAIQTIKEVSHNLSPSVLNNFGLVAGIQNFIGRLNETELFSINFECNIEQRFERNIEITFYRIITELINNTFKYAQSTSIEIVLNYSMEKSIISLYYFDNGKGFDLEKTMKKSKDNTAGLGLFNIYQRVLSLNGKIDIKSKPGEGMKVLIELQVIQ